MQVPAPFAYERAATLDDAISLKAQYGEEARFVAGGHSLLPMMKLRLAQPETLIDINDCDELFNISVDGEQLRVGAMVRHRELLNNELIYQHFPIFRDAEKVIADPCVRNRGTIGGSLCQADPAEDLSAVCAVLDAMCVMRSPVGERVLSINDFHVGAYETALADDEILTEVRFLIRPNTSSAYHKVERRVGDWAIAAAGASLSVEGETITHASVALAAVGAHDAVPGIAEALVGQAPGPDAFNAAAELAAAHADPDEDQRGTIAYKTHLAAELTRRSLADAADRLSGKKA